MTEERPLKHKMRRYSDAVLQEARRTVEKWSEDEVIEPSASDYSSAPVLVKKSDGTYRMCIDYRDINAQTVKDAYLVGSMDAIPDKLSLYHFRTMPFGLTNTPATFNRLVNALFGPQFEPNVFAYLDDIIIVSKTYEEHLEWLKFVLDRLVA